MGENSAGSKNTSRNATIRLPSVGRGLTGRADPAMQAERTFVTKLLRAYHGRNPDAAGPVDLPTMEQIDFLCDVGLGPIAFKVYGNDFERLDSARHSVLRSVELTTRAIYRQLEEATVELAGELQNAGVVPIFLKGISVAAEFYAPPHLRVMGDIDILVQREQVDIVMARVMDLGYENPEAHLRTHREPGAHHLPAALHPRTGVVVEVHTGLFATDEFYAAEAVFRLDNIARNTVEFDYRGTRAARFTPEFQFIFTASKWSADRDWAVNMMNINDMVHILRKYQATFDWTVLSRWFADSPHLVLIIAPLLRYLERADIVTLLPQMNELLVRGDRQLGPRKLKMLAWLLRTFPFGARNRIHGAYARWCAHAIWLYSTRPHGRSLGIRKTLLRQLSLSALYGKYNPVARMISALRGPANPTKRR